MGNAHYISTRRFKNHSKALPPSSTILISHFDRLDKKKIADDQTGSANWFIAELEDDDMGGDAGQIYLIFNPTNGSGDAVDEDAMGAAKLAAAPCPPFCDDESHGIV